MHMHNVSGTLLLLLFKREKEGKKRDLLSPIWISLATGAYHFLQIRDNDTDDLWEKGVIIIIIRCRTSQQQKRMVHSFFSKKHTALVIPL